MSLLDAYRQKLAAQIQEHKAQLDLLKARARRVAAQSRILGYEELAEADKHLEHVKARFKELKGAGSHAFEDIKSRDEKSPGRFASFHEKGRGAFQHPCAFGEISARQTSNADKAAKTRKH